MAPRPRSGGSSGRPGGSAARTGRCPRNRRRALPVCIYDRSMTTPTQAAQTTGLHGGRLVAKRLRAHGVTKLFTLSGGHLFSIYDGCRDEGIDIVDVRHEQSAAFAAEGWAKATRSPGVCALTAGPGVTNGMSAMASALQNASPMLVLGGRAPAFRWGQGSLQEIDHVPFVQAVTKLARTGLYWARGEEALVRLCEELSVPVFVNGLGRGCVPADHPLYFSRARGTGLKGADVALVIGVPMDFRLGFGGSFGDDTQVVVIGSLRPGRPHPREPAAGLYGGGGAALHP